MLIAMSGERYYELLSLKTRCRVENDISVRETREILIKIFCNYIIAANEKNLSKNVESVAIFY